MVRVTLMYTNYKEDLACLVRVSDLLVSCDSLQTVEQGAQTIIHLAVSEEAAAITGQYFQDCKVRGINWNRILRIELNYY